MFTIDGAALSFAHARELEKKCVDQAVSEGDPDRYMLDVAGEVAAAVVRIIDLGGQSLRSIENTPAWSEVFLAHARIDSIVGTGAKARSRAHSRNPWSSSTGSPPSSRGPSSRSTSPRA